MPEDHRWLYWKASTPLALAFQDASQRMASVADPGDDEHSVQLAGRDNRKALMFVGLEVDTAELDTYLSEYSAFLADQLAAIAGAACAAAADDDTEEARRLVAELYASAGRWVTGWAVITGVALALHTQREATGGVTPADVAAELRSQLRAIQDAIYTSADALATIIGPEQPDELDQAVDAGRVPGIAETPYTCSVCGRVTFAAAPELLEGPWPTCTGKDAGEHPTSMMRPPGDA